MARRRPKITWWMRILPDPVALQNIFENPSLLRSRLGDIVNLRTIPIWRARDTPLRSLYRLYEIMASGHYVLMGAETEYFWYQSRKQWELHSIEDPKDPDPVRYAILACLVEELTVAFNWRLSLGMRRNGKHFYRENDEDPYPPFVSEQVPSWTKYVPPIDPKFLLGFPPALVDTKGRLVLEEGGLNKIFANRNIITNVGWLYTI
ncbi:MAG: hypothetical protein M1834_002606 [Cirrosporium novae-zelandiae]|nr:MAG: hypothetical protein M1834_002606 [Cirrosporium novae-zelandiae]